MVSQKSVMATDEEELKLQFLICGICEVLPASYVKLRSYLNIHISNIAERHNLKVLKTFRNRNKTCPYCHSPWSGDTTSFKLFPSKKSKYSQVQNNADEGMKEKIQLSERRNSLILKCNVCSKKSLFSLIKKKPVEKITVNEVVEPVKKKKKKDKTCGLTINIKKCDSHFPKDVTHEKKKRIENSEDITSAYPSNKNSQINQLKLVKNKLKSSSDNNKNLMLNPYAVQIKRKFFRKNNKILQRLKKTVKEEKKLTRNTLKDFLTLV